MSAPPRGPRIRIVLIDDHALVREGVRLLLESQVDLALVGEASHRAEALDLVTREQPDVVLLDLDLGGDDGLELIRELPAVASDTRVLVLTGVRDVAVHREAARRGAAGIVAKEKASSVLITAIRKVHAGELWIDRGMVAAVLRDLRQAREREDPEAAKIATLTAREREIVALIARGLGTARITERLAISEKTVRNHLVSVYSKLGVSDRLELAIYAARHGLASPTG